MADLDKFDFLEDFRGECRERLGKLNHLALELEKSPGDMALVEAVGRELHTLKAASRLMGFEALEAVVHKMEDLFEGVYNRKLEFDSRIDDVVLGALDAIEAHVSALPERTGEEDLAALVKDFELMRLGRVAEVRSAKKASKPAPKPPEASPPRSEPAPKPPETPSEIPPRSEPEPSAQAPSMEPKRVPPKRANADDSAREPDLPPPRADDDGESVRVRTSKLDELFNLVGELVMCKLRSRETESQLFRLLESIRSLHEDWSQLKKRLKSGRERALLDKIGERFLGVEKFGTATFGHISADSALLHNVSEGLRDGILQLRMLPLQQIFRALPRVLRDIVREEGKDAVLELEGENIEVDRKILEQVKDPLIHLVRNAVSHGIELPEEREAKGKKRQGRVTVRARRQGSQILMEVSDDGHGIDFQKIRQKALSLGLVDPGELQQMGEKELLQLIFLSGFSTQDGAGAISGRGVGLNVVENTVSALKGSVSVNSQSGCGTTFTIRLPLSLATSHVLLIRIGEEIYALPIHAIQEIILFQPDMIEKVQNRDCICIRDRTIPLVDLASVLGSSVRCTVAKRQVALVVSEGEEQSLAFLVDEVLGEQEIVAKSLGSQVRRLRHVQGASILGKGEVVMILNVSQLLQSSRTAAAPMAAQIHEEKASKAERDRLKILVVDDSITTRRLEQAILEAVGYEVETAVNGKNALAKLKAQRYDLMVCDIQMPEMDGLELTEKVNQTPQLKDMPVVIVSAVENEEYKKRAFAVGARGYIAKGQFNQDTLISLIEKLTG